MSDSESSESNEIFPSRVAKRASSTRGSRKLGCYVIPHMLVFSDRDWEARKQVVTIFNPYDFGLHYILKTTTPARYNVPASKGWLEGHKAVDIPVYVPGDISTETRDKFLIEVQGDGIEGKGKKIIRAKLVPHEAPKQGRLFILPLALGCLVTLVLAMALGEDSTSLWLGFIVGVTTMYLVSKLR